MSLDPALLGNDPMADAPSPEPGDTEMEIECAELSLPNLYQLLGEHLTDRWVLFQELGNVSEWQNEIYSLQYK